MSNQWLIVCLGNPGKEYLKTRHNAGFIIADEILNNLPSIKQEKMFNGFLYKAEIADKQCIFVKPQTFMNNSGLCVLNVSRFYKIPLNRIIVLHDDTNFKIGKIKIKQGGSAGGHKGVSSIIEVFNNDDFVRVKIGVNDKPSGLVDLKDWVLTKFSNTELSNLKQCADDILDIIKLIIDDNMQTAMNQYNRKTPN